MSCGVQGGTLEWVQIQHCDHGFGVGRGKYSGRWGKVSQNVIKEKFPLELLEPMDSVDLVAAFTYGAKGKLVVRLSWQNADGERFDKTVYPTL